jgi:hypothetical protein
VRKWYDAYSKEAKRLFIEAKYPKQQYDHLVNAMKAVVKQKPLSASGGGIYTITGLPLAPNDRHTIFMRIDPPRDARIGSSWDFDVQQWDGQRGNVQGGSRYRVVINKPPR